MRYQYRREPLINDEVSALERACETARDRLILYTLLDTGLRVAELAGLHRHNVDFQTHRLVLFGKGNKRRVLKMTDRIRPLLESHFAVEDCFPVGKRTIQRTLQRLANRAAIVRPTSPHVLRHTFSVTCLQKGISLPTLQRLLGHSDLATTQIYTNLSPEMAMEEFARKW
jgi:integrase/recombinase XerD